jgi:hypothetical protein
LKDSRVFLLQEKILARIAKKLVKAAKNSRRSRKIRPTKRSEAEIQFRSDEESAEKAKEFQPLDFAQRTDNRRDP